MNSALNCLENIDGLLYSKGFPLILRGFLDRIPVVIHSKDQKIAQNVVTICLSMLPFRSILHYPAEVATNQEFEELITLEQEDCYSLRSIVVCQGKEAIQAAHSMKKFTGWVFVTNDDDLDDLTSSLGKKVDIFMMGTLHSQKLTMKTKILGRKRTQIADASHEKGLIQEAIVNSKETLSKIKGFLKNLTASRNSQEKEFFQSTSELEVKVLARSLRKFHTACLIAHMIYQKAEVLNNLGFRTSFSDITILDTIQYRRASIERINYFISKEWHADFSKFVEKSAMKRFEDRVLGSF